MSPANTGGGGTGGGSSGNSGGTTTGDAGAGNGSGGEQMMVMPPTDAEGWTDFMEWLVESDGSYGLGNPGESTPSTGRDTGSKIVYFDTETGTEDGDVYFWEDGKIVDESGSSENAEGEAYGTDPFEPNLNAIKPWRALLDKRDFVSQGYDFDRLAAGYPDWYLFRRGQTHSEFAMPFGGGRTPEEPMLVGAFGPLADGRARMYPEGQNPFKSNPQGKSPHYYHVALVGLDIAGGYSTGATLEPDKDPDGNASSGFVEDCTFLKSSDDNKARIVYPPRQFTMRRSSIAFSFDPDEHNQGYFTAGPDARSLFEEVIFYRNGYKSDPRLNSDPVRDTFSRNVYEGGGAQMGHTYRGIISADGASGGPQMRFGGLIENSLIVEGYWFSSADSNTPETPWPSNQEGESAIVRNNVQLSLDYPSPADPDSDGGSSEGAQLGDGYTLMGSSFGATIEGNIISNAMMKDDLGADEVSCGITIGPGETTYPDGQLHGMKDNVIVGNIVYGGGVGFRSNENWGMATGMEVLDNVFAGSRTIDVNDNDPPTSDAQLSIHDNRFYVDDPNLPDLPIVGSGNELNDRADAASAEGWTDPDRTLGRYVTEVLGLERLDWADDPHLDPGQAAARADSGEAYDPTGLRTFMAIAVTMRRGGTLPIPTSGKPVVDGDYVWDPRLTGTAVVNWVREGFGQPPVSE